MMKTFTRSLKGKLAIYFAATIVISLLISGLISVGLVQQYLRQRTISDLEDQSRSLAEQVEADGLPSQSLTRELERVQDVRVFIVPFEDDPLTGFRGAQPNRGPRAEPLKQPVNFIDWKKLEQGETQTSEADLPGFEKEAVAAAHGFSQGDRLAGAVVVSKAVSAVAPWEPLAVEFLIAALIALAISLVFAFLLARHLSRPLHDITRSAVAVADGDFSHEVTVQSKDEIGELADAFRYMTDEVRKSQEQQRQFVINVSHELKTPLTAIAGHVQALRDGVAEDPETVMASLQVISTETRRLNRLIEDLLSLAKFDASQFELRSSTVDLPGLLTDAVQGFSRKAADAGVSIEAREAQDIQVTTDPDRLQQILSNLVQNAITHTPAGGRVTISAALEGDQVRIDVVDTGTGISARDLPYVFDRFYRNGKGSSGAGLGLGLAISRELARAMGGDISVTSGDGEGSTFSLRLPA